MTFPSPCFRLLAVVLAFCLSAPAFAAPAKKRSTPPKKAAATTKKKVGASASKPRVTASKTRGRAAKSRVVASRKAGNAAFRKAALVKGRRSLKSKRLAASRRGRSSIIPAAYIAGGPWLEPTFADSTIGDSIEGEDLTVRRAAVEALGPYNGTVVVADPQTGRVLTIVNQKTAFRGGYQPCSTVKVYAALAGLNEGIIDRDTNVRLYGRTSMNLTTALARSNNPYFANIGVKLGYDKIAYYSRLFGLGEKALLDSPEEQPGTLPPAPPANGGMAMMTSFGEGILLTPLQLAATLSAVANGGTLYWLQYPKSQEQAERLVPRVKRHLPMQQAISALTPGMLGAVEFGTARRAAYDPNEPIFGKTGTCTDRQSPTHLGWFGSFNDVGNKKLVVVVLLTGGRPVSGPVASGVAGQIYRTLSQERFFAKTRKVSPVALVSGSSW